jgi:hypothetical protein
MSINKLGDDLLGNICKYLSDDDHYNFVIALDRHHMTNIKIPYWAILRPNANYCGDVKYVYFVTNKNYESGILRIDESFEPYYAIYTKIQRDNGKICEVISALLSIPDFNYAKYWPGLTFIIENLNNRRYYGNDDTTIRENNLILVNCNILNRSYISCRNIIITDCILKHLFITAESEFRVNNTIFCRGILINAKTVTMSRHFGYRTARCIDITAADLNIFAPKNRRVVYIDDTIKANVNIYGARIVFVASDFQNKLYVDHECRSINFICKFGEFNAKPFIYGGKTSPRICFSDADLYANIR